MTNQAWDEYGNEIFLITANVVVPTNYYKEAVVMASAYIRDVEQADDWQPEKMLPTKLSLDGKHVSHHLCSRTVYTNQVSMMTEAMRLHAKKNKWCAEYYYELDEEKQIAVVDDVLKTDKDVAKEQKEMLKAILNNFCIVCCPLDHFLELTGLIRIG